MRPTLYFSDLLPVSLKYKSAFKRIKNILDLKNIQYKLLKSTNDIWCRDYMPVHSSSGNLIQFRYEPSYLDKDPELRSIPGEVMKANTIKSKLSNINLDGGNVIMFEDRAIFTDRVVFENPEYSNKHRLFMEIEELLEVELIVMPADLPKYDMTGHIDGMMCFLDLNTLTGNDLDKEERSISDKIRAVLDDHGLDYIPMPFFEDHSTGISAIGIYVNYLVIEDFILFPIFETPKNFDIEALDVITTAYPSKEIIPLNINEIGREGGLMNCISWVD